MTCVTWLPGHFLPKTWCHFRVDLKSCHLVMSLSGSSQVPWAAWQSVSSHAVEHESCDLGNTMFTLCSHNSWGRKTVSFWNIEVSNTSFIAVDSKKLWLSLIHTQLMNVFSHELIDLLDVWLQIHNRMSERRMSVMLGGCFESGFRWQDFLAVLWRTVRTFEPLAPEYSNLSLIQI